MSIANLQQNIPNRQLAIYNFPMPLYDADKFADWLTAGFENSKFKSFSALADAAGLSRSSVSALAGAKKQPLTDKPSQPKPNTVITLAKALGEDVDRALAIAGYAGLGEKQDEIPKPIFEALAREGKLSPNDEILIADFITRLKQNQ